MLLSAYNLLLWLARPLLRRKLRRRGALEPLYLHATHQRFANYTAQELAQAGAHAGQWVWIHAVSLGETRAAAILLQALRQACPDMRLLLTHGTATGWQEGQKLLHAGDMQVWLPWDERRNAQRFVRTFRPRLGLIMETEIWPQLLLACQQHNTPVALANARMSAKTLRQSLRFKRLAAKIYGSLSATYAQSEADAQRLRTLQARAVQVTGNLKFDATPDPTLLQQGRHLRGLWQQADASPRPVAMLASSRDGEEQLLLAALQALPASQQHLLHSLQWLIVPRHPQRFEAVAALFTAAGWQVRRRIEANTSPLHADQPNLSKAPEAPSASATPNIPHPAPLGSDNNTSAPVLWLGNSMGEMPLYYGMADIVLMGGSFAPLGGQNLIEACACGCPVLLGPHTFNFAQASEQAIAAGAALRCTDMAQAVVQAADLLLPPTPSISQTSTSQPASAENPESPKPPTNPTPTLPTMQQAAHSFSQMHQGAAQRLVADLQQRGWL